MGQGYQDAGVVGIDVSDRKSEVCWLNSQTGELRTAKIETSPAAFKQYFEKQRPQRVALETGTHSAWIAQLFLELGIEAVVANARQLKLISKSRKKTDANDALLLAQLAATPVGLGLLQPVKLVSYQQQLDRVALRAREDLVEARVKLQNAIRGLVKPFGVRLCGTSANVLRRNAKDLLPEALMDVVMPLLDVMQQIERRTEDLEEKMTKIAAERYPAVEHLRQVNGVGLMTAYAFVVTIGDPARFTKSRAVGPYLGLTQAKRESGDSSPDLGITKSGNRLMRSLLVNAAHYMLCSHGKDSDLRRWGLNLARGGKQQKKRAVVALARRIAVLLHRLWVTGAPYEPLRYPDRLREFAKDALIAA